MTHSDTDQLPEISVISKQIPALAGVTQYQHPQTQLLYAQSGVLAVITQAGRYVVPPKHGIIIPAKMPHEIVAKTDVDITACYFVSEMPNSDELATQVMVANSFLTAMMTECRTLPEPQNWQEKHYSLLLLIYQYLRDLPKLDTFLPYPQDQRLLDITDKLLKHPSLKSDLVSWGKFVKTSARTLTRVFKKETGITYSQWRQRLNVQIAIKHLAQGEQITEIAKLLGYESSSAFIYMFRQQMGISPKQFVQSTL